LDIFSLYEAYEINCDQKMGTKYMSWETKG